MPLVNLAVSEGKNIRRGTWFVLDEVISGNRGIGGNALTTEAVQAIAADEN